MRSVRLAPIDVCVVIDDVHELPAGSTAAELLGELVARLPPHAHLVLAGRSTPPCPLTCAVRRARWSTSDRRAGLHADRGRCPRRSVGRDAATEHGLERLAGWPSLVRLALSAPDGSAPQFLWEEIVAGLTVAEQRLLLALATLGWGTASDVAWVAGVGDGGCDPLVDARLESLAEMCPAGQRGHRRLVRVHHLWEDAVERIFPDDERASDRRRALELFQRRRRRCAPAGARCAGATPPPSKSAVPMPRPRHRRRAAGRHRDAAGSGDAPEAGPRHRRTPAARTRPAPRPRLRRPAPRRRVDNVVDEYVRAGDHDGAVVALVLGDGHRPHARRPRQVARRRRAGAVAAERRRRADAAIPRGRSRATTASLEGDPPAAVAAIEAISLGDGVRRRSPSSCVRLHANMLCLCGRADEAVPIAAPMLDSPSAYVRTLHPKVRWLAGDPAGFPGGHFDVDVPPGTNERYRLYHALYGMAVATSFGDRPTIEALERAWSSESATIDVRDDTMLAFAVAVASRRRPRRGDGDRRDRRARRRSSRGDRVADGRLRRLLAVAYVCDERVRERWRHVELGPSLARQRDVADDLLAARAGDARRRITVLAPAAVGVDDAAAGVVGRARRPRRRRRGASSGLALAEGLAELAPAALRVELEHAAAHDDDMPRRRRRGVARRAARRRRTRRCGSPCSARSTVEVAGAARKPPTLADLRRQRVRTLLELLVLAGPMRRDRIGELMWPDLDPVAAGRNVRVTLSRLRAVARTGPGDTAHATGPADRQRGRVAPTAAPRRGRPLAVPRRRRRRRRRRTARRPPAAIADLERACARWRGEPFADLDPDELTGAVEEVRTLVSTTALRLGELLLVAGRFDEAATWADRVIRASPYDERAHRLALPPTSTAATARPSPTPWRRRWPMLDDLGVEPEPETQMLLRQAEDHIGHPARPRRLTTPSPFPATRAAGGRQAPPQNTRVESDGDVTRGGTPCRGRSGRCCRGRCASAGGGRRGGGTTACGSAVSIRIISRNGSWVSTWTSDGNVSCSSPAT